MSHCHRSTQNLKSLSGANKFNECYQEMCADTIDTSIIYCVSNAYILRFHAKKTAFALRLYKIDRSLQKQDSSYAKKLHYREN